MRKKTLNIIEIILVLIMVLICIMAILKSSIFENNYILILGILIPILLIIVIEILNKNNKKINKPEISEEELEQIKELSNVDLNKVVEEVIQTKNNNNKTNFKKMHELNHTIQIPLEEIQNQAHKLSDKDESNNEKKANVTEDTMVLFTKDELKEAIKKELESTETVDNVQNENGLSTNTVENIED